MRSFFYRYFSFLFFVSFSLTSLITSVPVYAASALAAWLIRKDGVLVLRTTKNAKLRAFFQSGDNKYGDRLWIDFPGELAKPRKINGTGPVKEVRLGKPYTGKTRLVIEFDSDVRLNPYGLKLIGISNDKWTLKFTGLSSSSINEIGEGQIDRSVRKSSRNNLSLSLKLPDIDSSKLPNIERGRYLVVLDPGHGGIDPGAVGISGLKEKDVVLDVSRYIYKYLTDKGVKVRLTRNSDIDVDLYPRVAIANRSNADAFISIHANATRGFRRDVSGLETYYFSGYKGYNLAKYIQNEILYASPDSPDRGVRKGRFYVIGKTNMPAALVEIGFVTGRLDSSLLSKSIHRKRLAFAISKGILKYLDRFN